MSTPQSSGAVEAINGIFESVNKAANKAVNTIAQNVPFFNSLVPLGNTAASSTPKAANNKPANNKPANNSFFGNNSSKGNGFFGNNGSKGDSFFGNNTSKESKNLPANTPANTNKGSSNGSSFLSSFQPWAGFPYVSPMILFSVFVVILMVILVVFNEQVRDGYEYVSQNIKHVFGYNIDPDVISAVTSTMPDDTSDVTVPPIPPQSITPAQEKLPQPSQTSFVERILPSTKNEVFNIAQNKFTFYDAEPLCNALGAELATYEQVKNAWESGADWCNYGWVKGQMAVYPTQKATYDRLQSGREDERGACGTVGINGGYFDNPEFKYGVTCYGKKPEQSAHDQKELMEQGKYPKTPDALKYNERVNEFKSEADSLFIKPFNDEKWFSTT
jgi:hypothetical protein